MKKIISLHSTKSIDLQSFLQRLMNTLKIKIIGCKMAVLGFVRCCYFAVLLLTHFRLMKCNVTLFRTETIFVSFLYLMAFLFKMSTNHFSKRQFVVLLIAVFLALKSTPKFNDNLEQEKKVIRKQ